MTIQEKAIAYDKVREKIDIRFGSNVADEIFSQFEMSEDDKIRKELIDYFSTPHAVDTFRGIPWDKVVAWLEKQGEQKPPIIEFKAKDWYVSKVDGKIYDMTYNPADKVEPKFKVGDWAVSNLDGKARQISEVHFDEYNRYYVVDGKSVNLEEYDRLHHLWTIQDAKDGDVLVTYDGRPFIYKGCLDPEHPDSPVTYCGIDTMNHLCIIVKSNLWWKDEEVYPATEEERDTLMKAMADAGFTFDFDKKELKRIEQTLAWSEEDEEMLQGIIDDVTPYGECPDYPTDEERAYYYEGEEKVNWLKSLKDRVQPKQQEWSEEDAKAFNRISAILVNASEVKNWWKEYRLIEKDEMIRLTNFLKSLKDKYAWKPSDEQIEALESATENCAYSEYQDCLRELIEQLKKLKE